MGWASDGNSARQLGQYQNIYATTWGFHYEERLINILYRYLKLSCIEANIIINLCTT